MFHDAFQKVTFKKNAATAQKLKRDSWDKTVIAGNLHASFYIDEHITAAGADDFADRKSCISNVLQTTPDAADADKWTMQMVIQLQ